MGRHQIETIPLYWPFVRGIHRSPMTSPIKTNDAELWRFLDLRLNRQLSKQWRRWWFQTLPRSLWRHCNDRGGLNVYSSTEPIVFVMISMLLQLALTCIPLWHFVTWRNPHRIHFSHWYHRVRYMSPILKVSKNNPTFLLFSCDVSIQLSHVVIGKGKTTFNVLN